MATTTTRNNNINLMNNQNLMFLNNNSNNLNNINMNIMNMNSNNKQDDHYLFEYIYDLYINQLYGDVIQTVRFFDNNLQRFRETFGLNHGLNVLFFYGISLYQTHEYKLALQIFQQATTYYSDHFALLTCKNTENLNSRENSNINSTNNNTKNNSTSDTVVINNSINSSINSTNDRQHSTTGGSIKRKTIGENITQCSLINDSSNNHQMMTQILGQSQCTIVELKYQIHLCYKKLGESQCAINTLQSISRESQTLKTLLALGDLCLETNNYREALICYKNAVFKNPLAFCTLKKYLNHANEKRAEEFVILLSRKIESKLGQNMSESFQEYIRAQKLARHPKNFKQVSQLYFDLGKGYKTSLSTSSSMTSSTTTSPLSSSLSTTTGTSTTPPTTASTNTNSTSTTQFTNSSNSSSLLFGSTATSRKSSTGTINNSILVPPNQQTPTIVQSLQLKPMTYDNMYLMLDAARNLYYDGYISNANYIFQKIYSTNRNLIEGTDCWASCLYRDAKYKQLSQLTCDIISMCSATNMARNKRINNTTNGSSNNNITNSTFGSVITNNYNNNNNNNNSNGNNNNNSSINQNNNNHSNNNHSNNNHSNNNHLNNNNTDNTIAVESTLASSLTGPSGEILNLSKSNSIMKKRPEPWIVIGFYNLSKRDPKAIMFANKALTIDSSSEEAMILKTLIYNRNLIKDNGNFIEEIRQFIYRIKNQKTYIRFEFLKYLAEAVLEKEGRDAAEVYVKQAIDRFGMSTRICTFYCSLIYSDPKASISERERALNMLEESVKATPFYMSATVNLVKFYMRDGNNEKAIPLLEKLLEKFHYEFIHLMLIACYKRIGQHEKAEIHKIDFLRSSRGCEFEYQRFNRQKAKEDCISETLSELDLTNVSSISTYDEIHDNSFDRFSN